MKYYSVDGKNKLYELDSDMEEARLARLGYFKSKKEAKKFRISLAKKSIASLKRDKIYFDKFVKNITKKITLYKKQLKKLEEC